MWSAPPHRIGPQVPADLLSAGEGGGAGGCVQPSPCTTQTRFSNLHLIITAAPALNQQLTATQTAINPLRRLDGRSWREEPGW